MSSSSRRYDVRARKRMSDCVHSLHKSEQWEVYRILDAGGLKHTRNAYGLFFDVTNAPDDILARVQNFIEFVQESRKYLDLAGGSVEPPALAPPRLSPQAHDPQGQAGSPSEEREPDASAACASALSSESQSESVQMFVRSMIRLRDENPALKRRETSRFQAYRKKYSRQVNQKASGPASASEQLDESRGDERERDVGGERGGDDRAGGP